MQKTAFITGATGLVGAKLVIDLYSKGYNIVVLKRKKTAVSKLTNALKFYTNNTNEVLNKINIIEGDVLDLEILYDNILPEYDVYHCAAMVSFNPKFSNELTETNVQGTANLVNVCCEKKIRKFCHVSSIGALGTPVNGGKTDIDSPWLPNTKSPYSISKHESELEVWRGIAEGLNAVIVNPAVILGAGDWNSSSAAMFSRIANGMKYFTHGSTSYVDVADVTDAMVKLMESEVCCQRFIISAENLQFKEVFDLIAKGLNVKPPYKKATPFLTSIAWRFEHIRIKLMGGEPKITKHTHKVAHSLSDYNGEPICSVIDFKYTSIKESIKSICQKYFSF